MKRIISIWILLLCAGISKVQAQNDATLAGMILVYTNKAEKELKNQANHRACVDKRRSGRYDGLATGVQQLPELVPFDCLLCGADLRFLP